MNKKIMGLIVGIVLLIVIFVVGIYYFRRYNTANNVKNYLVNKYGFNSDELVLKSLKFKHNVNECVGECFSTRKVQMPLHLKFNYKDEVITVVERDEEYFYDDYLYDELYYGVAEYYADMFGVDSSNVYYDLYDESDYPSLDYLARVSVTEINNEVIEDYLDGLNNEDIKVYIKMNLNDVKEEMIKKIEGNLSKLKFGEEIELYSSEANFVVKELLYDSYWDLPEKAEYYFFKSFFLENNGNYKYKVYSYET